MKKSDLQAGYTLEDEQGRKWFLINTSDGLMGIIITNYDISAYTILNVNYALNDDLTLAREGLNPSSDIVKIYGLDKPHKILRGFSTNVIWQRDKQKEKTTITLELTDDQITKLKKLLEGEVNV